MCYITKGFLVKGTTDCPMLNFILKVSGDMIWIISSRGMATTIISQIQIATDKFHREAKPQCKLPVPIGSGKMINKIQIHIKVNLGPDLQRFLNSYT